MRTLRVVVADDEKMARKRVVRLLATLGHTELVAECRTGEEVLVHLDPDAVDVALLDIDMPGLDGLATAKLAADRGVPVIFVTAHADHAVSAFDRGAVHFLLKPLDLERLETALERVRSAQHRAPVPGPTTEPPEPLATPSGPVGRLALTVRGDVVLVPTRDVTHALYDGELVTVYTHDAAHISAESLQEVQNRLGGEPFLRVHRRALLNLDHTERLRTLPTGGYVAVVSGGGEVPVSRQAARDLRKRFGI